MGNARVLEKQEFSLQEMPEGHAVLCNSKIFKTPAGNDFIVPTVSLAEAILVEWRAQGEKIKPDTMPMNQLAATTLDIISKDREAIIGQVAAYASAELLCHRVALPAELALKQSEMWQPLLDWCALEFDAPLKTTVEIMPVAQSDEGLLSLRNFIKSCDDFMLAGLRQAVDVSGSLILGLALLKQHLTPQKVLMASELDADFQSEKWGADPATETRRAKNLADLEHCAVWFKKIRG